MLVVALALAGLGYAAARLDAWRLGDALIDAIVCAVGDGCPVGSLEDAYGDRARANAAKVRAQHRLRAAQRAAAGRLSPLPVGRLLERSRSGGGDRSSRISACRSPRSRTSSTGGPKAGRSTSSTGSTSRRASAEESAASSGPSPTAGPGFHPDDWEGYQIRIAPGQIGSRRARPRTASTRTSSTRPAGDRGPAGTGCRAEATPATSSRGRPVSAARALDSVRLVPLELLRNTDVHRFEVSPPWEKAVYRDPESEAS